MLFVEHGSSLTKGLRQGIVYRNMAQYERFLADGDFQEFYWFSYDPEDHAHLERLRKEKPFWNHLHVLTPPRILSGPVGAVIYSLIGPLMHWRAFAQADVLRVHQVSGSWTALLGRWIFRKPLLFRLGYPLSHRFKKEGRQINHWLARIVEKMLMRNADHAAVTSQQMFDYYHPMAPKTPICILPNYVDVSGFTPLTDYDMSRPFLFVARLAEVKNLENIIAAVARIGHSMHVYGGGPLEERLKQLVAETGARVEFRGFVSNTDLQKIHHHHSIYILCSHREGLPKALVEAMASGLICVVTPAEGIVELVEDGKSGYVTDGFDADAIEKRLRWVMENYDPAVGRGAVEFIHRTHSLDHAVELERDIYRKIIPQYDGPTAKPALAAE